MDNSRENWATSETVDHSLDSETAAHRIHRLHHILEHTHIRGIRLVKKCSSIILISMMATLLFAGCNSSGAQNLSEYHAPEDRPSTVGEQQQKYQIETETEDHEEVAAKAEKISEETDFIPENATIHLDVVDTETEAETETETEKETEPKDGQADIICIGSSITVHPYTPEGTLAEGYWLADWGMAASSKEKDYAHVLAKKYNTSVVTQSLGNWEMAEEQGFPRIIYMEDLDPLFEGVEPKLVVLQFGESCTAYNKLYTDLSNLVEYIKEKAPNAVIAITGTIIAADPIRNMVVDGIKQTVAKEQGCVYVDMSGYNASMWAKEGTQIVNDQGEVTTISFAQQAHPGDYGMYWIAEQIETAVTPFLPQPQASMPETISKGESMKPIINGN